MNVSNADPRDLTFRRATVDDAASIATLVNQAYRGDSSRLGWTTEADLVDGSRTTEAEVRALIRDDASIILLCLQGSELVGSVHLQHDGVEGHLGMFVVRPALQNAGIGKRFMAEAETTARTAWGAKRMAMNVISIRLELIAFYERRGYRRTGRTAPFPQLGVGMVKVPGLQFEILEKDL